MKDSGFKTLDNTLLSFNDLANAIKKFIEEDSAALYTLTIGTDSESKIENGNKKILELISAIAIYRKGYGGKYFIRKIKSDDAKSLRDKIYREVLLSIEIAQTFIPVLKSQLNGLSNKYKLEIHIDVGERGATSEMIKEVVGMVTGNGFVPKTKPYSYAASNIADRHV